MRLPAPRRTVEPADAPVSAVRRLAPLTDPLPVVLEALAAGPTLVLHPSAPAVRALATRLRKRGLTVAVVPEDDRAVLRAYVEFRDSLHAGGARPTTATTTGTP